MVPISARVRRGQRGVPGAACVPKYLEVVTWAGRVAYFPACAPPRPSAAPIFCSCAMKAGVLGAKGSATGQTMRRCAMQVTIRCPVLLADAVERIERHGGLLGSPLFLLRDGRR